MAIDTPSGFVPIRALIPWPEDLFTLPETADGELDMIDRIGLTSWEVDESDPQRDVYRAGIALVDEVALEIPGLEGFSLVIGAPDPGSRGIGTEFTVAVGIGEPVSFGIEDVDVALRMRQDLLKPVERGEDGTWVAKDAPFELRLLGLGITVDLDGGVELSFAGGAPGITMPAFTIGDTGIVVEADQPVRLYLSNEGTPPAGRPAGWRGVHIPHAAVHLPHLDFPAAPEGLEFTDCSIGSGGFTGDLDVTWAAGAAAGSLLGVDFELRHVGLDFVQNAPVAVEVGGQVTLPFFDQPVGVDIGFGIDGSVTAELAAVQPAGATTHNGLVTFEKPDLMSVSVDGLGLEFGPGHFLAKISGRVKPLLAGIEWPEVTIQELSIDQDGHVHIEGGWLDLDKGYSLEFYGFRFDITKLGFGHSDDGGRWIGFSGGLKLVDGMPAGASVEGLRVTWYEDGRDPRLTLAGVGVEFEVPNAVHFKGAVSYREFEQDGESIKRFDGDIALEITAISLEIDAGLVIGTAAGPEGTYTFFAIFLGVELPAGIPLGCTGLGLFGFAGLFALNMEPGRRPDEPWYGVGPNDGWYKRPQIGVTDLRSKWDNERDSIALGVGTTLGTVSDNGYTFSGRILLVLIIPGPIIMLEGKANLLKERATLSRDPLFRTLAVLDFRSGTALVGLDVHYKQDTGGELIDISGGVEAFFDFNDANAWHIHVGEKEPRERRIRANLFQLFDANTYLMLDAKSFEMGAWIGFDKNWEFGPLTIDLEAWLEAGAALSFKPPHFTGYVWLHGKVVAKVFGIGFNISADAKATADVFDPMHLVLELSVKLDLPWPLPDFGAEHTLEWGPTPSRPPIPLPLKEVAVEHFKVTTTWPLPRAGAPALLLPSYDAAGTGFVAAPVGPDEPASLDDAPIVPLDGRPHLTFGRAVHDEAQVGVNAQPVMPNASPAGWEWIGDPDKNEGPIRARFRLVRVALERRAGPSWTSVAEAPAVAGVPTLYGSWAPVPQLPAGQAVPGSPDPVGNTKLWLWSKSAFDYTRATGRSWDEWFLDTHPGYPCVPAPPPRHVCCDFQGLALGTEVASPWSCAEHPEVGLAWSGKPGVVTALHETVDGLGRALCFGGGTGLTLTLPPGGTGATIVTRPRGDGAPVRRCVVFDRKPPPRGRPWDGLRLDVRDAAGAALPLSLTTFGGPRRGLRCGWRLTATLPRPAIAVELELGVFATDAEVRALDARGRVVDGAVVKRQGAQRVRLRGAGIARVVVIAPQDETVLYALCTVTPPVTVTVDDKGTVREWEGTIAVTGGFEGTTVHVGAEQGLCVVRVCVDLAPDPVAVAQHAAMDQHMRSELARWSEVGEVLEPDTHYRLRVVTAVDTDGDPGGAATQSLTEYAYFRTTGPPGIAALSVPQGNAGEFASGLDDLTRYVEQTVPPTVPPPGQLPVLPRPVYRAYDIAVRFNEDYVDQLYRSARRDLSLRLYDPNDQPLRDASGRLLVAGDQWGATGAPSLSEAQLRWIWAIETGSCARLDPSVVPSDRALTAADGHVLLPDAVHEARLVPLLLHDAFATDSLAAWTMADHSGTSAWQVRRHGRLAGAAATVAGSAVTLDGAPDLTAVEPGVDVVELTADTARSTRRYTVAAVDAAARRLQLDGSPALPAAGSAWELPALGSLRQSGAATTTALTGDTAWTDLRVTVLARLTAGAAGVVVRGGYRFTIDRAARVRRLVRVQGGAETMLAEDRFAPRPGSDYELTLEAVGDRVRAFLDGAPVFDVQDAALASGRVGLHAAGAGASFRDVRVDDLRPAAPVVNRFGFTTSRFATFAHHVHSGDDGVRRGRADVAAFLPAAVAPEIAVAGEPEQRAFEGLAAAVLGPAAHRQAPALEVTAVEDDGGAVQGLLVEASEPVDWRRTSLALGRAAGVGEAPAAPGVAKLVAAQVGAAAPNEEWVELLLRDALDPSGLRVQRRLLPGPLDEAAAATPLFAAELGGPDRGLLHLEALDAHALDRYEILDEEAPGPLGASHWALDGGAIAQTGSYVGAGASISGEYLPGTIALLRGEPWGDVRVEATLRTSDFDGIGVVLRHDGAGQYYRFSVARMDGYRRLVKRVGGTVTVLWEDGALIELDRSLRLVLEAHGDRLVGWLDDAPLFDVTDADLASGRVGLYAFKNGGARFEALRVESIERPPVLWAPALADLSGLEPSSRQWSAQTGVVTQAAPARPVGPRPIVRRPRRTFAAGGDPAWTDVQAHVRLRSDGDGQLGLAVRYRGARDHYRFVLDRDGGRRALERVVAGRVTELWSDAVAVDRARDYDVTVRAEGSSLRVSLDGDVLCAVTDDALVDGRIALYCADASAARFERLVVGERTRSVAGWRISDAGSGGPSAWRRAGGVLSQSAAIGETRAVAGPVLTDARIVARLRCDDDGAAGVLLRCTGPGDLYRLVLDSRADRQRLEKVVGGTAATLWEAQGSFDVGAPFTLVVDATGDRLVGRRDGRLLFDLLDGAHDRGRIGVVAVGEPGLRVERLEARRPPLEARALLRDAFAAGSAAGWTVVDEGTSNAPSAWGTTGAELRQTSAIDAAPGTPEGGTVMVAGDTSWTDVVLVARLRAFATGAIGLVVRRTGAGDFYRFSMDRAAGRRRLVACAGGTVTTLWEDGAGGYDIGRAYDVAIVAVGGVLRGFVDGVPTFAVEDATHPRGAVGLACWGNTDARFSSVAVLPADVRYRDWLLDEGFAVDVSGRWAFASSGAGTPTWTLARGELRQTGDADFATALAGDPEWRDLRLAVRLRTDAAGGIGVLVRQSAAGYYLLRFDAPAGRRELVRVAGASETVLWSDATIGIDTSGEHLVTLDCVGARLSGWLDGRPLFAVEDPDALPAGRIGLRAEANAGARFAEVQVGPPAWVTLHELADEETLPAGARLRLHTGSPDVAPAPAAGVRARFAASAGEQGLARLPASGARLRVVGSDGAGAPGHERDIRPAADFADVPATDLRMLRRADGTAFFLHRATGPLDPDAYRLTLTFRRDNTIRDPESPILSQAGSTAAEVVTLDIRLAGP